jgi:aminoglycoside 3-N-acetyltransferase
MSTKTHDFSSLTEDFKRLGIKPCDNVLIHSSMKSIGEVKGGADTVLDVFCEYLAENGNIALPTHSWAKINYENPVFDPEKEPSCVGILPEIFRKRKGVIRSLHPTHSIAVMGKDAEEFVKNEHLMNTPCGRRGCWGKLINMDFRIMFLGCGTKCNTFIHGVEEWNSIPERLSKEYMPLKIVMPGGTLFDRPMKHHSDPYGGISQRYDRIMPYMENKGYVTKGKFGDADCVLIKARDTYSLTSELLRQNVNFFGDE